MFGNLRIWWDAQFGNCPGCKCLIAKHHMLRKAHDDIGNVYFGCMTQSIVTEEKHDGMMAIKGTRLCDCVLSRNECRVNMGAKIPAAPIIAFHRKRIGS